jgi:hypothetical protein
LTSTALYYKKNNDENLPYHKVRFGSVCITENFMDILKSEEIIIFWCAQYAQFFTLLRNTVKCFLQLGIAHNEKVIFCIENNLEDCKFELKG